MTTRIQTPFFHQLPATFFKTQKDATDILSELVCDAKDCINGNPSSFGGNEFVLPEAMYTPMFHMVFQDPLFKALEQKGLMQYELTEVEAGDNIDSITLIAFDKDGYESFRQKIVFYDLC